MGPKSEYRNHAKEEAMVAAYEQGVTEHFREATVGVDWYDSRKTSRDELNVPGYLKAGFDGLQDAGIVENDRHLRIGEIRVMYDKVNPRVELIIQEIK